MNGPAGRKKDMTGRVTELGRKTRQETVKWKPKNSPDIPDRGRHQKATGCV